MTKKRKKKSKNWASKEEDAEAKPFGVEEPVHNNEKSLDRRESPIKSKNPPQNTAPVAFSKQKKRKREEVTTIPSPHGDQLDNVPTKKKKGKEKKKKKKKKMRQRTNEKGSKTRKDGNSSDVEGLNTYDSSVTLEGCLVDDVLVLIDRSKGIVYSATDVSENGNRKEVGKLDNDGGVVFFQKPKEQTPTADFPFDTDPDDHCESPLQAYQDIVPFLKAVRGKSPISLCIYDPYYCNGAVSQNLKELGFPKVYNRKEDCYEVWDSSRYPSHDVLITNPPYSGSHIEKLIHHITSPSFGDRPWMLLLPQWVHKKEYFLARTKHIRPFYLVPQRRYVYLPPPSFRQAKKSDVHKKSSPFISMWYIWGGTMEQNERWLSGVARRIDGCEVARSKSALRDLRRKGTKKKPV